MTMEEFLIMIEPITSKIGTVLAPFTDTLAHRFWFALVLLGIFTVLRIIIFNTEPLLPVEFEFYDARKRLHWKIFAVLAGGILNAGWYPGEDAVYSLPVMLRNNAPEEWLCISVIMLGILAAVSALCSVRYFWLSHNLIVSARVWFSHLFFIGVGMVLTTVLEYVGCFVIKLYLQGGGLGYILFYLYPLTQIIAIAGTAIYMTSWFFLSFFAEETLGKISIEMEQQKRQRQKAEAESESSDHSIMMIPSTIRDAYGNVYHSTEIGLNSRDYFCSENGNMVTICDSDIDLLGRSAHVGDEYMYW